MVMTLNFFTAQSGKSYKTLLIIVALPQPTNAIGMDWVRWENFRKSLRSINERGILVTNVGQISKEFGLVEEAPLSVLTAKSEI